jgi:tetraacyldisaccharide 4'-kinase
VTSEIARLWFGDTLDARAFRAATWPLAAAFGVAAAVRSQLYDRGLRAAMVPDIPVVSVGNLTVGGTGKTPFAAWLAARLARDARPAIVMRGYGGDEASVHQRLNPDVPVIESADRAAGVREARRRGADVVVLDDAFQHRRLARVADIVLLSAEQLTRPVRLLPAGPWREPLSAARRANLVVVTRKSATQQDVSRAVGQLQREVPGVPIASAALQPLDLVSVLDNARLTLDAIRGRSVLAIAAVGEPALFATQLEQLGARVTLAAFPDHHAFTAGEVARLARDVPTDGFALCTLKDAAKLRGWWPEASRLWYVSQQLVVEHGDSELERVVERVLASRETIPTRAD